MATLTKRTFNWVTRLPNCRGSVYCHHIREHGGWHTCRCGAGAECATSFRQQETDCQSHGWNFELKRPQSCPYSDTLPPRSYSLQKAIPPNIVNPYEIMGANYTQSITFYLVTPISF